MSGSLEVGYKEIRRGSRLLYCNQLVCNISTNVKTIMMNTSVGLYCLHEALLPVYVIVRIPPTLSDLLAL